MGTKLVCYIIIVPHSKSYWGYFSFIRPEKSTLGGVIWCA